MGGVMKTKIFSLLILFIFIPMQSYALDYRVSTGVGGMGMIESGISEGHKAYHDFGISITHDNLSFDANIFFRGEPPDEDPELLEDGVTAGFTYRYPLNDYIEPTIGTHYNHWCRGENIKHPTNDTEFSFITAKGGARWRYGILYADTLFLIPYYTTYKSGQPGFEAGVGVEWGRLDIGYKYKRVAFDDIEFNFSGLELGWSF